MAADVDIGAEDLGFPADGAEVGDEQLILLERDPGVCPQRALGRLVHDDLEGLVPAEVHLLGVPVGARVGELPVEAQCSDRHQPAHGLLLAPQPAQVEGHAALEQDHRHGKAHQRRQGFTEGLRPDDSHWSWAKPYYAGPVSGTGPALLAEAALGGDGGVFCVRPLQRWALF